MKSPAKRKVIIIGATSGIGKEMALQYVKKGYYVGITGRREILLHQLQQEFPLQIFTECFDVRGEDNIEHLNTLIRKLGGVDIFIFNAGYGEVSTVLNAEIERATYETNVKGFVELTAYMFNYFLQQGRGHLAATSSIASAKGNSFAPAYSASKAFMSTYMEGLHMKAKKLNANLKITDIQPGFIKTKLAKGNKQFWVAEPKKATEQIIAGIESKRWRIYVTRRWWLVAKLMKYSPSWLYHRIA
jgi:short-subunit dehydrogenase